MKRKSNNNKKKYIFIIAKVFFAIIFIIALINIIIWYEENKKVEEILNTVNEYISVEDTPNEVFESGEEKKTYKVDKKIKRVNKDIIGWIKVDNTKINYPLVKGKDNKYYLKHDLNKRNNSAGWVFMDYRNNLDDQNIIIYGHHRKNGTMFGSIDDLFKHPKDGKILLVVNGENRYYQIFSIYKAKTNESAFQLNFNNFQEELDNMCKKSVYDFKKDLSSVTHIITLSTCSDDNIDRLIVQAYRIF